MRWMKLEPVIQSEVSQKEKHQYSILMHIYGHYSHALTCSLMFNYTQVGEGNGTPLQHTSLENPMDRRAWWAAVHGVTKSQTRLSDFTFTHWRGKWQPTQVFLPGESQGRRGLVGCRLWGLTESDTTEAT